MPCFQYMHNINHNQCWLVLTFFQYLMGKIICKISPTHRILNNWSFPMCWDPPSINFLVYAINPITDQFDFYFIIFILVCIIQGLVNFAITCLRTTQYNLQVSFWHKTYTIIFIFIQCVNQFISIDSQGQGVQYLSLLMTHKPICQNMESNHQQQGSFMVGVPRTRIMVIGLF